MSNTFSYVADQKVTMDCGLFDLQLEPSACPCNLLCPVTVMERRNMRRLKTWIINKCSTWSHLFSPRVTESVIQSLLSKGHWQTLGYLLMLNYFISFQSNPEQTGTMVNVTESWYSVPPGSFSCTRMVGIWGNSVLKRAIAVLWKFLCIQQVDRKTNSTR